MRRQFPLFMTVFAVACASGQSTGGASAAERERVVNLVPFDLANCFPQKLDLGKTANEYTLQAAFRAARPEIGECLVDAKVQNPAGTKGKATIGMDASGTTITVAAEGLKPDAIHCIESAIRSQLAGVTLPAGAKPISLDAPIDRDTASMVRMGINESSDIVGAIRLSLPQWCSCFESLRTQAPPELEGPVSVVRPDVAQYADRFKLPDGGVRSKDPVQPGLTAAEPSGAQAASCVNERIAKMQFKTTPEQLVVPVQLLLLNSSATKGFAAGAPPPMQFAQLDAIREQRQADAFAALARRQNVANTYDAQVQAYQAAANSKDVQKRKAAGAMVKDLKTGCAALVKADDGYTKALEEEAGVEQQALTLAQTLKAKDPVWTDAEKASAGALADTQKHIDAAKQLRAANEKACPKEKF